MGEVDRLAKTIWDYHLMHHQLKKADVIVALGSSDIRVGEYAARLYLDGWAPWLVTSGGYGTLTKDSQDQAEAELFAEIAVRAGVPRDKIIIENRSANTGQNFEFTRALLESRKIEFNSAIIVQKPYMERRTYATGKALWPQVDLLVASPPIAYKDYPNEVISKDLMINIMVGDLQRIREYPKRRFQIPQEIPDEVWAAAERLIGLGYNKHLIG